MSIADEIFAQAKAEGLKRMPIKAFGKDLWLWEMTAEDLDEYQAARIVHKGKRLEMDLRGSRARAVQMCLRAGDAENAERVFSAADLPRLAKLGGNELDRLFGECIKLNPAMVPAPDDEDTAAAKN